ncbi:flagellar biosynthesis anti-sigma factor FlgM [Fictibacillus terranigra]|uniref:Negative regulator of flagellin synthesis n=1 Tax=Fictibacillus terranigra TaxID=3058424 RepID=A0ABT8E7N7_9BACL|nr:flagellar biosynthesis anti-sigma factor FlgM [Fictibacillus sp. CENA-BCM004]MDN4073906.1 flagellar biosynthesis anti-sigma factor FlgM [Fictibacillus sp. CENA-BCM004]
MEINRVQKVEQVYKSTPVHKQQPEKKNELKDKVEISEQAQDLFMNDKFTSERSAKIEELKQKIQAGEYTVDADAIARKIASHYQR